MGEEKEPVEVRIGVEAAKDSVRSVKLSQGHLSFRSRKLLRNSLFKGSAAKDVDKRATVLPAAEDSNPERSKIRSKEAHRQPANDASKVEKDVAKATTRSSTRQGKKLERTSPSRVEQVKDGSAHSDGMLEKPPTQQLSPKFKLLETFYEGLEAACSLLRIRKQMCTFRAVCKIVESISKRRFLLKHLAQIKHIFSEVMQLEYVRCQDPDSWGERWDLRVTLLPLPADSPHTSSPLKGSPGQKAQTVRRRKEFHVRLLSLAGSQPEDGDIPLGPLPRRPLGGDPLQPSSTHRAASPPSDRMSDAKTSAEVSSSGASTQPANAEPGSQIGTEEFQFSTVKPSRGNDTVPVAGTPHFLPSFRPFFSKTQPAEKVVLDSGALPHESHFPASFRPTFSAQRTSEATAGLPQELLKKVLPGEILLHGSYREGEDKESGVESRIGSKDGVSCSVSVNSSSLYDEVFHFPSSTPGPCANSKELPSDSVDRSCHSTLSKIVPSTDRGELPPKRIDMSCHSAPSTPVSSADRRELPPKRIDLSCHSAPSTPGPSAERRELPPQSVDRSCHSAPSTPVLSADRRDLPPKLIDMSCHSTPSKPVPFGDLKELSHQSVDRSSHRAPSTPVPSADPRELPSSSTEKSSRFSPSTPIPSFNSVELPVCSNDKVWPQTQPSAVSVSPLAIHTPPFLSPMKRVHPSNHNPSKETPSKMPLNNSVSPIPRSPLPPRSQGTMRSLRFASPTRGASQLKAEDSSTPQKTHSLGTAVETPPSSSARVVHSSVSTPSTPGPETPDLQNSVRTSTQSKEAWYSPPKRMRLRASLFANDRETGQETCTSSLSIPVARGSCPEAVDGGLTGADFSNSPQPEASKALRTRSIAKDNEGITESDLEVLQSLPQDIVQSVWEKERKMKDTSTKELAKQKRRQQMMSGVPKLFNQLRLIFQSLNRTVLPEHELIKTILTSHPEITDKVEVEERLKLVIELAPDYIHTRPSHSGELLYRVDKRADVVQIQRRLSGTSN